MRIAIVTLWGTNDNYGQVLQNFALQQYLISIGHECFTIRYQPQAQVKSRLLIFADRVINKLNSYTANGKKKREEARLWKMNAEVSKKRKFDVFKDEYLHYTPVITDYEQLKHLSADVFVVGSDQVWNISPDDSIAKYRYLQFATGKCLSYAASMGKAKFTDKEIKAFEQLTSHFSAISIREKDSCDYISSHSTCQCEWVLDPTFLLSEQAYRQILDLTETQGPDIFVYALNIDDYSEIYGDLIETHCQNSGLNMSLCCSTGYKPYRELSELHPIQQYSIEQWLQSIANAKKVITTSFHGIAFSLIFGKDFIYIPLGNANSTANNRVISLLTHLGLDSNIAYTREQFTDRLNKVVNVNYIVREEIKCLADSSKQFLIANI